LAPEALEDALNGLEPDQITGPGGLLTQLAGRVIETALGAELTEHLGHPPGGVTQGPNVRNGAGRKTVKTELGAVEVRPPRDRDGSFEPKLVAKRQTRLAGLDDRIPGLYAGGIRCVGVRWGRRGTATGRACVVQGARNRTRALDARAVDAGHSPTNDHNVGRELVDPRQAFLHGAA
jgi:hypothetical protein